MRFFRKAPIGGRTAVAALVLSGAFALELSVANAAGTARIVQRDGSAKTYTNVRITVRDQSMWITSSDGQGTLVFGKAACTKIGELVKCLPYDATLYQYGEKRHIALANGTVWLNPSQTYEQLTHSSTQLPPRGVLLAVETKAGTFLSLTGVVDQVQK
ncbi:MAG: hypothetical protein WAK16_10535 [Candidatus Cybelea sp.]